MKSLLQLFPQAIDLTLQLLLLLLLLHLLILLLKHSIEAFLIDVDVVLEALVVLFETSIVLLNFLKGLNEHLRAIDTLITVRSSA